MHIRIPCGKEEIGFSLDEENFYEILPPHEITLPGSDEAEITWALDNPVDVLEEAKRDGIDCNVAEQA